MVEVLILVLLVALLYGVGGFIPDTRDGRWSPELERDLKERNRQLHREQVRIAEMLREFNDRHGATRDE